MVGTFTRASNAYRQTGEPTDGSSKYLDLMGPNELRLNDNGDGYGPMVLLETTEFTNLVLDSEDISNVSAGWTTSNATVASPSELAPNESPSACVVKMSAGSNGYVYQEVGGTTNGDRVRVSFFAKSMAGADNIRVYIRDRNLVDGFGATEAITDTEWKRIESVLPVGTGVNNIRIGARHNTTGSTEDVVLWGFQAVIESGSVIARGNTYIPTTAEGPATQAPDFLTFTNAEYPASFRTDGYWVQHRPFMSSAEYLAASTSGNQSWILTCHSTLNHYTRLERISGVMYVAVVSSGQKIISGPVTWDAYQNLAIKVCPTAGKLQLQGFTTGDGVFPDDYTNILPSVVTWGAATDTTVTTGQPDPFGGTDAVKLDGTSSVATGLVQSNQGTYRTTTQVACEIWAQKDVSASNFAGFELRAGGTGSVFVAGGVYLHLGTGQTAVYGTGYSDAEATEAIAGWWRLRFKQSGLVGTLNAMRVRADAGFAANFPTAFTLATGPVTVYGASIKYTSTPFEFPDGNISIGGRLSGLVLGSGGLYYPWLIPA